MINNTSLQKWQRLRQKKLSQQFTNEIITGLNCSPFEAEAILEPVYRVFRPYFETNGAVKPGQLFLEVVSENAPPQLALKNSPMVTVLLTLDAGEEDLQVKEHRGVESLRQHRIERLCQEAYQQGGLLTVEDLANRLLNCGERTISRDIAQLRKKNIALPLRSTIKDMGRSITHRVMIIQHWLAGKEYTDISRSTCHSVDAVGNYIDKFKRTISLLHEGYDIQSISFLVKLSTNLVQEYISIYKTAKTVDFRKK